MTDVTHLIVKQNTATLDLWCSQCGFQFKKTLPVTFAPERLECQGCLVTGFVMVHTKLR